MRIIHPAPGGHHIPEIHGIRINQRHAYATTAIYSRLSAFLRFSPAPAPGAAPRFTAFAGLRDALELTTGVTFESAVPNGVGDTWRFFSFSAVVFASADSEDDTEKVFDADCCNGIVAAVVVVVPF